MDKEISRKWTAALRSGKYEQGYGTLRYVGETVKYCCLGVLCELAVEAGIVERKPIDPYNFDAYGDEANPLSWESSTLPDAVLDWSGMTYTDGSTARGPLGDSLAALNDSGEFTFNQIADLIDYFSDDL